MAHDRIRQFNKHYLNRVMIKLAGETPTPFAAVHHTGRKSGKAYSTPIIVMPVRGGFMIALTYGPNVDWYRNVLAAGQCTLRWHRKTYTLTRPQVVSKEIGLRAFPLPFRLVLGRTGTSDFVRLDRQLVRGS